MIIITSTLVLMAAGKPVLIKRMRDGGEKRDREVKADYDNSSGEMDTVAVYTILINTLLLITSK